MHCALQIILFVVVVVAAYKWKVCGNSTSNKSNGTNFPAAFAHYVSLCHLLVILPIPQNLLIVNIFSTVICDQGFFKLSFIGI